MKMITYSVLFLMFLFNRSIAQQITIGPGGNYPTLSAAEAFINPGDSVMVFDGIYSNGTQFLEMLNGSESQKIYIYSETQHGAIFQGGTEAIHLIDCSHVILDGFIFENQTGNGVNIDDGGNYSTPTHNIEIRNCIFRDMMVGGNHDLLKLSGLDTFHIHHCEFINGSSGGSGVDMVGCHQGVIEDNLFDDSGVSGIQAKGGTQYILIRRNILKDLDQRALNLGGSTGLQFFRPPLPNPIVDAFEAADLNVYSNIFIGSWAPIAYVGCVNVKVTNNTIYKPENWVIRILQETTEPGFLACGDNEFRNNIIYLEDDLTEVNIGSNTDPGSFIFTNNLWYNEMGVGWTPVLPVVDSNQVIADPIFIDQNNEILDIETSSPAIGAGKVLSEPSLDYDQNFYLIPPSIGAYEGSESTNAAAMEIQIDSLSLYPNPSFNTFKLEGIFTNAVIQVVDVNGNVIDDYTGAASPVIIDLENLKTGTYFIHVYNQINQLLEIKQIIKM